MNTQTGKQIALERHHGKFYNTVRFTRNGMVKGSARAYALYCMELSKKVRFAIGQQCKSVFSHLCHFFWLFCAVAGLRRLYVAAVCKILYSAAYLLLVIKAFFASINVKAFLPIW
jgi:hypothetical protein